MTMKYDELTLTHNLSGVILPTEGYKELYSNKAYKIPSVIAVYDDATDINATRTKGSPSRRETQSKDKQPCIL